MAPGEHGEDAVWAGCVRSVWTTNRGWSFYVLTACIGRGQLAGQTVVKYWSIIVAVQDSLSRAWLRVAVLLSWQTLDT